MFLKQVYDFDDKSRQCSFVHPGLPRRSSTGGSTILSRTTTTTTTHSHTASFFRDLSAYTASLSSADTASVSGVPVGGKFIFIYVRAMRLTACYVSTGDVGGGFASDRESHAAAARIAQQLARHGAARCCGERWDYVYFYFRICDVSDALCLTLNSHR